MKKIAFFISIIMLTATASFANLYIDGFGTYMDAGDAEMMPGFGGGLAYRFHRDFSIVAKINYNAYTKDPNNKDRKTKYSHFRSLAGLEYIYHMYDYRMGWRNSLLFGYSSTGIDKANTESINDETPFSVAFWTGLSFDVTQHMALFLDAGYHFSYYLNEFDSRQIHGFQVALGMRFTVWGRNRDYGEGY